MCIDEPDKMKFENIKNIGPKFSLKIEFNICKDNPDCYPEDQILKMLYEQQVHLAVVQNGSLFNPREYGDQMVAEFCTFTTIYNISKVYILNFLVQHQATSEESWLGLGIGNPNAKTWFDL